MQVAPLVHSHWDSLNWQKCPLKPNQNETNVNVETEYQM